MFIVRILSGALFVAAVGVPALAAGGGGSGHGSSGATHAAATAKASAAPTTAQSAKSASAASKAAAVAARKADAAAAKQAAAAARQAAKEAAAAAKLPTGAPLQFKSAPAKKYVPPHVADGGPAAPLAKSIPANRSETAIVKGPDTFGAPRGSPFTKQPLYDGATSTRPDGAAAGKSATTRDREADVAPVPKAPPAPRVTPPRAQQAPTSDLSI